MPSVAAPAGRDGAGGGLREVVIRTQSTWRSRLRMYPRQIRRHRARYLSMVIVPTGATVYARLSPWIYRSVGDLAVYTPLGVAVAMQLVLLIDVLFIQRTPPRILRFTPEQIFTTAHGLPVRHSWGHVLQVDERPDSLEILLDEDGLRQLLVVGKVRLAPSALEMLRRLFAHNGVAIRSVASTPRPTR